MNYIYFNEKGRLKGKHLDDMVATSHLANKIYLFADLDTELETEYSVSLAFQRADGAIIGEIECLREASLVLNPSANQEMPAFSLELGSDILAVCGPLKITARYYHTVMMGDISREVCKAMGMVVANVLKAVKGEPRSTVISNINRRIEALNDKIDAFDDKYVKTSDLLDENGKIKTIYFVEALKNSLRQVGRITTSGDKTTANLLEEIQNIMGEDISLQRGCYFIVHYDGPSVEIEISQGHNIMVADDGRIGQDSGDLVLETNDLLVYIGISGVKHQWMVINNTQGVEV